MNKQIRISKHSNYPIPYINLDCFVGDYKTKSLLSKDEWKRLKAVPVELLSNKLLTVCVEEPTLERIQKIRDIINKDIGVFYSTKDKINKYLLKLFKLKKEDKKIEWRG